MTLTLPSRSRSRRPPTGRRFAAVSDATTLERLTACAALFALGVRQVLHAGVTVGDLLSIALAAVWLGRLRQYPFARAFVLLGAVTAAWGIALAEVTSSDHQVNSAQRIGSTVLLLGIVSGIGVVLWARTVLSLGAVGAAFGAGMLVNSFVQRNQGTNPWKNHWAVPVAILLLSIVLMARTGPDPRRSTGAVGALLVLAAVSAFSDSRSYAATFVITALLVLWQGRPRSLSRSSSAWLSLMMMAAVALATYWLATKLLVAGYLGAESQARTIAQLDQSGSVITGGRPELQATLALMQDRPMGFGVGIVPTGHDILVAKSGLHSINYNPNNGYVEKYMFGGHVELHSLLGDLWAGWGLAGLVLLAALAAVLLRGLAVTVAREPANPVGIFLFTWDLWNLFFSPIYSSAPTLVLGVGLALGLHRRTAAPS